MGRHRKYVIPLDLVHEILEAEHPMIVRQVYYQLVSRQVLENCDGAVDAVGRRLVEARKEGIIPWDWIEDRLRLPRRVSMWNGLADFADAALAAYRRNVWGQQDQYIEVWEEKDALSGIFEDILDDYGMTLNVGRGYDGWSSIRNAAERYGDGGNVTVLYFGDFDPSGENMFHSLAERLAFFDCHPEIVKCALTVRDIEQYNLPPAPTKVGDTRAAWFIKVNGDRCVELDALPIEVLRDRIRHEVESRMDMAALALVRQQEEVEREHLRELLTTGGGQ